MHKHTVVAWFLLLAVIGGLIGSSACMAQEEPCYGGTLRYATLGEVPMLDGMLVSQDLATSIIHHVMEGLFAFDASNEPVPFLLESYEVENDGKLVLLHLRQGVLFHNADEMVADDVAASLSRWLQYGTRGRLVGEYTDNVLVTDRYTVEMHMKKAFGPLTSLLGFAGGGCLIYPKEIVETAGAEPIAAENMIGTGPYKFVEWIPGRHILLTAFEDYCARTEEPSGYSGRRTAYIKNIEYIPLSEVNARVMGLRSGDFNYAERIPADLYDGLKQAPGIQTLVANDPSFGELIPNTRQGIMSNLTMRKAVRAALDMQPILQAAYGPEDLWDANGSFYPIGNFWYTLAGTETYDQPDLDKVKQLLEEAGYNGEPIHYMTSTDYKNFYDESVIITAQLSKAGFNIDLQVYDWPTVANRRAKPELWDLFQTMHGLVPDPSLLTCMNSNWPSLETSWDTPELTELKQHFMSSTARNERFAAWEALQKYIYEYVPVIETGHFSFVNIASDELHGLGTPSHPVKLFPYFWNVWIDEE